MSSLLSCLDRSPFCTLWWFYQDVLSGRQPLLLLLHLRQCHLQSGSNINKVIVSCCKPSRSILNFFELILKAYTRGVPNRTTIFQDWAHQSFICCLFYLLWTRVKILSQEAKGPISFSANIADMCIPSQIICDSDPRYLMLSTFSRTVPSRVYETWIFFIRFLVICIILHLKV